MLHHASLRAGCLAAAIALCLAAPASAAVPKTLSVHGAMMSTGGGAGADGVYKLTFALYSVKSGGTAVWSEGPIPVQVQGGAFVQELGTLQPVSAALLDKMPATWLGLKVADEPEMARVPLHAVAFAKLADTANGLACSGCVSTGSLAAGAVSADKVGFTYAGAKTKGGPATTALDLQCTGCVGLAELTIDGDLDLGGNALKAKAVSANTVAAATFQGDGSKLTGIQIPTGECKVAGEVVKGINPDGSLKCIQAMDPSALPPDGIDEISNGLINNQFQNTDCMAKAVPIPDNNPIGIGAEMIFGDYGLAQKLDVQIALTNSDTASVVIKLFDPNNVEYLLWDKSAEGKALDGLWPTKTKVLKGDLSTWVNKNPKGKWRIQVIDDKFVNNGSDGAVTKFCVNIQTLSSKKVEVKGELIVDTISANQGLTVKGDVSAGGVQVGASTKCDASKVGTLRWDKTWGLQACNSMIDNKDKITSWQWVAARSKPIIWSGGCKQHSQGNGWDTYCLNGTDWNTSADYLSVASGGTVTAKVSGYYQIIFYADQHGCGSKRIQFFVNGVARAYGHYDESDGHLWHQANMTQIWPLRKGDTFYLRLHANGCNPYRWHYWNTSGNHSRLQIRYIGPLTN